jgi:hypothetical protein
MNIQPAYVTFEQAKLLKEKSYKGIEIDYGLNQMLNHSKPPEQHQVIEWLRIVHGIWIWIEPKETVWNYFVSLNTKPANKAFRSYNHYFKSPQAAYSAAIDYVLKELI